MLFLAFISNSRSALLTENKTLKASASRTFFLSIYDSICRCSCTVSDKSNIDLCSGASFQYDLLQTCLSGSSCEERPHSQNGVDHAMNQVHDLEQTYFIVIGGALAERPQEESMEVLCFPVPSYWSTIT